MLKPLPIGIQTFRDLIAGEYLYVDKTRWIYEMVRSPKGVYFLSRPRRFGKSLLLSTLEEVFSGRRDLFQGLWIYDADYRWETFPVLRVDFSLLGVHTARELEHKLTAYLSELAMEYGVPLGASDPQQALRLLIRALARRNRVVVLIDEYDKPIMDNLDDVAEARRIQDILRGFYTVLKRMDPYLRFVFLTGVTRFSKVGVFSGLNNLKDISMDDRYATMLGITHQELQRAFAPYLAAFAANVGAEPSALLERIRRWYDGFCFSKACHPVYNPFSLLLFFDMQDFRNYWFETGTPSFLIHLITHGNYPIPQLEHLEVDELAFSSYEVERLDVVPLLFQTGYLTIKAYDPDLALYTLGYPNLEVENAFRFDIARRTIADWKVETLT